MELRIEQLALAPADPHAAYELLHQMGAVVWVHDMVTAEGEVRGREARNVAHLAFDYKLANKPVELELLDYKDGPNWLQAYPSQSMVSHLGMHCTEEELVEWKAFFAERDLHIVQEVDTIAHTNEELNEIGRRYHYCIFGTRGILGVDIKMIVRKHESDRTPHAAA